MPRPGFVLDVDRSTPPTLFWHGEGFRLEKLPAGRSRVRNGMARSTNRLRKRAVCSAISRQCSSTTLVHSGGNGVSVSPQATTR